jgi:uncharacterized protein (TIGR02246 family)
MKSTIACAALAAASLLSAGCSIETGDAAAPAIDPVVAQQAMDRWQIEELLWRYARTLDSADADGYAAVYTTDGSFTAGQMSVSGQEALHKFVADLKKTREERAAKGEPVGGTLHMTANHHIAFNGPDSATVHSYWITMFPGSGAETPSRVGAVGRAEDQLVRVDGKWLIKVRNVAPQD